MVIKFSLEVKGDPEATIESFDKLVSLLLQEVADQILSDSIENLVKNDSFVTGLLAKSGRVEFDSVSKEAEVIFGAPYAAFVEFGTRPHVAPLGPSLPHTVSRDGKITIAGTPDPSTNPLDFWAWRKGKRKATKHKKYGVHTQLGLGLWFKIMRKGTDPHPFMRPAIAKVKANTSSIINKVKRKSGLNE